MASCTLACRYLQYYLPESTEPMVARRFIEELGFYAYFIGPSYSKDDALRSVTRIWSRYFGPAVIPAHFIEAFYYSLRAVAVGISLSFVYVRGPKQISYNWGSALFELVAIAMFRRWYRRRAGCPIPFEYPELVKASLPPKDLYYWPRLREYILCPHSINI